MSSLPLLIIAPQWPEPQTTAAGRRTMQLIRCFQQSGHRICFASTTPPATHSADLEASGVEVHTIQLNDSSFDTWLSGQNPGLVLFDRFHTEEQFGWRVARTCPRALRILDTQDLHSLRLSREKCFNEGKVFGKEDWLTSTVALREVASIFRSDIALVISSFEVNLLRETFPAAEPLLCYLPFMEDPVHAEQMPPFDARSGFLCIGNGRHQPNVDAMTWLTEDIWQGIRQMLPAAELTICGAYLPGPVRAMHDPGNGIQIRGWVPDAREEMRTFRLQLAPLRFGAGLKGKLADSMASGCPFVTTPVGSEGMLEASAWAKCIASGADEFIERAVTLYRNKDAWSNAQQLGMSLINSSFNRESLENGFLARVDEVTRGLSGYRKRNLIGAMMMHHRMASTMYLSKWIEAKTRINNLSAL